MDTYRVPLSLELQQRLGSRTCTVSLVWVLDGSRAVFAAEETVVLIVHREEDAYIRMVVPGIP
jgi:hypothetical protein